MDRFVPRDDLAMCSFVPRGDVAVWRFVTRDDVVVFSLPPCDDGGSVIASEAWQSMHAIHDLQH